MGSSELQVATLLALTTFLRSESIAPLLLIQVAEPVVKLFLDPVARDASRYYTGSQVYRTGLQRSHDTRGKGRAVIGYSWLRDNSTANRGATVLLGHGI